MERKNLPKHKFKNDKQRKGYFGNLKNKAKLPSRQSRAAKDYTSRGKESIKNDRETIRGYNRKLANAGSKKEKIQIKRKIRTKKKTITRRKKSISQAKKRDREIRYISKTTHSNQKDSEQLHDYVESKNVMIKEIDWDELKGADLSYEKKQKILNNQIKEE